MPTATPLSVCQSVSQSVCLSVVFLPDGIVFCREIASDVEFNTEYYPKKTGRC